MPRPHKIRQKLPIQTKHHGDAFFDKNFEFHYIQRGRKPTEVGFKGKRVGSFVR
jgi:hypothetical protein